MKAPYLGEAGRSAGRVSEVKNSGLRPRELLQEKRSEAEERNATDGFYVYRTYIFLLVLFAAFAERNLKCRKFRRMCLSALAFFYTGKAGVCVRPVIHASGKQGILHCRVGGADRCCGSMSASCRFRSAHCGGRIQKKRRIRRHRSSCLDVK